MRALVTGASGFVGSATGARLKAQDIDVVGAVRQLPARSLPGVDYRIVGSLDANTDWRDALTGVDVVVHCAARVHVMRETASDPLAEFRRVNTAGTERLARMAATAGVRRLVLLSTVKVNGEKTLSPPHPHPLPPQGEKEQFCEEDPPNPQDPYAVSKWEAEQVLARVAADTGLEIVILRPPLVYGPGVKGNFLRLLQAVSRGIPLPFGSVRNARSLIFIGNLVDAIMRCMTHPAAAAQTYLVCDGEKVSTPELISRMARALGRPARLWPLPPGAIRLATRLAGREEEAGRLLDSLVVDGSKIRRELNWIPPYSLDQGLRETARWYRQHRAHY